MLFILSSEHEYVVIIFQNIWIVSIIKTDKKVVKRRDYKNILKLWMSQVTWPLEPSMPSEERQCSFGTVFGVTSLHNTWIFSSVLLNMFPIFPKGFPWFSRPQTPGQRGRSSVPHDSVVVYYVQGQSTNILRYHSLGRATWNMSRQTFTFTET